MDLSQVPLFSALMKRMSWLTERQSVLAENVANAEIPGYQAQDLAPPDFRSLLTQSTPKPVLAVTDPRHIEGRPISDAAHVIPASAPGGGRATVEDEMMKVSQTANDYALVSTVYRANLGMLKTVLGRSS
jgi:flagellar basal-body rod protein FlgB